MGISINVKPGAIILLKLSYQCVSISTLFALAPEYVVQEPISIQRTTFSPKRAQSLNQERNERYSVDTSDLLATWPEVWAIGLSFLGFYFLFGVFNYLASSFCLTTLTI